MSAVGSVSRRKPNATEVPQRVDPGPHGVPFIFRHRREQVSASTARFLAETPRRDRVVCDPNSEAVNGRSHVLALSAASLPRVAESLITAESTSSLAKRSDEPKRSSCSGSSSPGRLRGKPPPHGQDAPTWRGLAADHPRWKSQSGYRRPQCQRTRVNM